jgi:hypothetical protein
MEASGTSSVPQDTDGVTTSGGALAGAAGTAAPGAVIIEAPPPPQPEAPRRRGFGSRESLILTVCCVAQFMVILDLSIVNVALPSIQSSLNFTSADLQWVVDAYAITFAGFLMLGGRYSARAC